MLFVAFISFLVVVGILMVLVIASGPKTVDIGRRLSRVLKPTASASEESSSGAGMRRAEGVFVSIGKMMPAPKKKRISQDQLLLIRAGYRNESAFWALQGLKLVCCIAFTFITIWTGLEAWNPLVIVCLAVILGWTIPEFFLHYKKGARQKRLRKGLPDAMDLLVICVEVGLGLDQSLLKVSEELQIVHPELSAEFQMVNLEMRVGKARIDALRELAQRTGLEDIKSLVSILVQTDRFGTSIVQALRTYSDELRTKRRQRAEEMAAKVSVKMVPVLVFFIFPAVFIVIIGPAFITIYRTLLPTLK